MNKPLAAAAIFEIATGVALIVAPVFFAKLLLGSELSGLPVTIGRLTGISLLSLGFACWPGKSQARGAAFGMATYGVLVTLYLTWLGIRGEWFGPLLWPAVGVHTVLTVLLLRELFGVQGGAVQGK
ncbi:hypothetical protein [Planctomicrobium piriforme]|uniref:Uncharacterized protein n=1 Tax=Planctomicrobium piriforme TaxID=1576369 RepID=A0A1I3LVZ5_9PLAN|nr:hypothetical protein [Planctomicrobium piriforme]SFI88853.1 hypothetical protein SAMN05421753_11380 [Planctomicrobium piriforme]